MARYKITRLDPWYGDEIVTYGWFKNDEEANTAYPMTLEVMRVAPGVGQ